jgi:hypothetical protein
VRQLVALQALLPNETGGAFCIYTYQMISSKPDQNVSLAQARLSLDKIVPVIKLCNSVVYVGKRTFGLRADLIALGAPGYSRFSAGARAVQYPKAL